MTDRKAQEASEWIVRIDRLDDDMMDVSIFHKTKCSGPSVILAWPFRSLCQFRVVPARYCLN